MKYFFYLIIISVVFSCNTNTIRPKTTYASYTILYDSIITMLPGNMQIKENIFIWQDGFAKDSFLHVVDLDKKTEILKTGKIGRGPGEFVTPNVGLCTNGNLFVHDMNGNYQAYFSFDSLFAGIVGISQTYVPYRKATRKISIGKDEVFSLSPDKTPFLFFETPDTVIQFGDVPFKEQFNNGYDLNQGFFQYNQENNLLVYAAYDYPYIAIYKKNNLEFQLLKTLEEDFKYTVSDNEIRINPNIKGISGLALSKNFIIVQRYDNLNENDNHPKEADNRSRKPSKLFIYDYNGILVKIIDFGIPLIRINANNKDDTVFAIVENPEYILISCSL